jgi:hypothetical protein
LLLLLIDCFVLICSLQSISYYSPLTIPASTSTNAAVTTTTTTTNPSLASTTNTRGGDSISLNRSAPDRKTIHNIPTRQHYPANSSATNSGINPDHRSSTRTPNNSTMAFGDTNSRYQQGMMMSGANNGAQSFLSKLSSKFARR